MTTTISTANAGKNFADVVLTRRGRKIAALVSMKEFELLRQIENHLDVEDARKALAESGDNLPASEVWKQL